MYWPFSGKLWRYAKRNPIQKYSVASLNLQYFQPNRLPKFFCVLTFMQKIVVSIDIPTLSYCRRNMGLVSGENFYEISSDLWIFKHESPDLYMNLRLIEDELCKIRNCDSHFSVINRIRQYNIFCVLELDANEKKKIVKSIGLYRFRSENTEFRLSCSAKC